MRILIGGSQVSNQDRSFTAEPIGLGSEQQQSESSGIVSSAPGSRPSDGTDIEHNEVVSDYEGVEDDSNQNSTENVRPQHNFRSEMNIRQRTHA